MASEVSFHEEASAEFEIAFEWYYLRSEFVASRFVEEMNKAIVVISDAPQRWPIGVFGTRKYFLHHFPFSIVYREIPSGIQVLAVAHGHRKPGYWKKRL